MVEKAFPATAPDNQAEMEATITEMFAEMDRIDERIRRRQQEIDRKWANLAAKREKAKVG